MIEIKECGQNWK